MAKKYINISNATTELLASTMKQTDGNVKSINIANTHNTITVSIGLYLESLVTSTDDFYFFKRKEKTINCCCYFRGKISWRFKRER